MRKKTRFYVTVLMKRTTRRGHASGFSLSQQPLQASQALLIVVAANMHDSAPGDRLKEGRPCEFVSILSVMGF